MHWPSRGGTCVFVAQVVRIHCITGSCAWVLHPPHPISSAHSNMLSDKQSAMFNASSCTSHTKCRRESTSTCWPLHWLVGCCDVHCPQQMNTDGITVGPGLGPGIGSLESSHIFQPDTTDNVLQKGHSALCQALVRLTHRGKHLDLHYPLPLQVSCMCQAATVPDHTTRCDLWNTHKPSANCTPDCHLEGKPRSRESITCLAKQLI